MSTEKTGRIEIISDHADDLMIGRSVEDGREVVNIALTPKKDSENLVIKLSKDYVFDDELYSEIDLNGLKTANTETLKHATGIYRKTVDSPLVSPELSTEYAFIMAHILSGLPLEFFDTINIKDGLKIKNCVIQYIFKDDDNAAADQPELVANLSKEYQGDCGAVTVLDLTGIEELNTAALTKAKTMYRKYTKDPIASPERTTEYAMCIASIVTELPVKFFDKLLIRDAMRVKNRVIDFLTDGE